MNQTTLTSDQLHPLIEQRWSPWAFDNEHQISEEEIVALLEAARWTASSNNTQPWRFIVGRRGDGSFERILASLNPSNAIWAPSASAPIVALHSRSHDGRNLSHGAYDLGAAVAQLALQATAMDLHTHQMGGFSTDVITTDFGVPEDFAAKAVIAVGAVGDHDRLPEKLRDRHAKPRQRLELGEIAFSGAWGKPAVS